MEPGPAVRRATRAIVTVVNVIGAASMPYNEFVTYRANKHPEEQHVVIVWDTIDRAWLPADDPRGPKGTVEIIACQGNLRRLMSRTREVVQRLRLQHDHVVVHLHQPRSGLLFHLMRPMFAPSPPVVFTVHNAYDNYSLVRKIMTGVNFLLADEVTFVSRSSWDAFPRYLHRLRTAGVSAVRNGVDVDRVDDALRRPRAPAGTAHNGDGAAGLGLRLLNVGRFVEQKHHRFLIELLAQLPACVTLTLVGDGPLRRTVAAWASEAGLTSRVRFTGLIPREQVYDEMRDADVFVSSSRWEGLPIAALEAMTAGLPVALSDIDSHREIAEVAVGARVLPLRLEEWRTLILEWSALPAGALAQIGQANRRAVVTELSLARMHERYTEIYRQLAG